MDAPSRPPAERSLPYEGPLAVADARGESGSMAAGPGVRVSIRLDDEVRIAEIAFETAAFDTARPVASRVCGALLGTTLAQASAVTILDVARMGGVRERSPEARTVHFAKSAALLPLLGRSARDGVAITCTCYHVATEVIRAAIRDRGLGTVEQVKDATKACSGCGTCRPDVQRLLDETPDR